MPKPDLVVLVPARPVPPPEGHLEVGILGEEVVINLPRDMTGHIHFAPEQARHLAELLVSKAAEIEEVGMRVGGAPFPRVAELRHRIHSCVVAFLAAAVPPEPLRAPEPLPHVISFLRDLTQTPDFPMQAEAALLADRLAGSSPAGSPKEGS